MRNFVAVLTMVCIHAACFALDTSAPVPIKMIFIKGSEFVMGYDQADVGQYPELKLQFDRGWGQGSQPHSVRLSDFYMSETTITQEQYFRVMGYNPLNDEKLRGANMPVYRVSWYDAILFCNSLSKSEGKEPVYSIDKENQDPGNLVGRDTLKWTVRIDEKANGYRLPTAAEFEYAAKGGLLSKGFKYPGSDNADDVSWYCANSGDKRLEERSEHVEGNNCRVHEVKTKKPNELGLYDMSGNVWQWLWDWAGSVAPEKAIDPKGPEKSGMGRWIKGGSYFENADYGIPVVNCNFGPPNANHITVGFRVVKKAE